MDPMQAQGRTLAAYLLTHSHLQYRGKGCFCFKKKKDCGKGYASKKTLWAHKNICKNRNTVPKRREGRKGSPIFTTFLEETSLVMFLISTSMLLTMANLLRPSEF